MFKNKSYVAMAGRSMVEMLGVLAVIGILTIGGIASYTYAMKYYRINEIKTAAMMYLQVLAKNETQGIYKECSANKSCTGTSWEKFFPDTGLPLGVLNISSDDIEIPLGYTYKDGVKAYTLDAWVEFEHTPEGTEFCNFFCNSFGSGKNEDQTGLNFGQPNCWNQCGDNSSKNINSYSADVYIPVYRDP